MKKYLLLLSILMFGFVMAKANKKDELPVSWKVSLKHVDGDTYQINAEAKMQDGYHIWALEAGGDGSLINTSIEVEDIKGLTWGSDHWLSDQTPKKETYEFIDGEVNYFEKQVSLSRQFKAQKGTVIKLMVTYQACNEAMCFPPQDVPFELKVQ